MKNLRTLVLTSTVLALASVVIIGCGGQGGGTGGGSFGSIGSVSFDIVGTAQTPVNRTSTTVSFSGVAGATLSGVRYNDYNTQPIMFSSDEDGISRLFGMTQTGALRSYLLNSPAFTEPQAHPFPFPSGQSYAFCALNTSGKWQLKRGFFALDSTYQAIGTANAFNNEQPTVGPDENVYFVSDEDGNKEIWKVDIDSNRTKLTNTAAGISNEHPFVSRDGQWLVYQSNKSGNNEIYAIHFTSGSEVRLTTNAGDDVEPTISPDSMYVTFASNRSGNYDIYRALLRTGALVSQLTTDTRDDREPMFSPDGLKIFFTSTRDDTAAPVSTEIYSMTRTGASQSRISVDSSYNQKSPIIAPYLSPSLSYLGFTSTCSGIIVGHNNTSLASLLMFDITTPTDANRGLTRVTSETLTNPSVPVIYYTISTPTSITTIRFSRVATSLFSPATILTPINTATDALVTYSASGTSAGQVLAVLPYAANRSPIRKKTEGGNLVVEGSFPEVYNSEGKNIAPGGASVVKFNSNGEIMSWR